MAINASVIIDRVQETLLDETEESWEITELLDYLNASISLLILNKPDATATTTNLTLTANNSLQSGPTDCVQILEVIKNASGRSIIQVDKASLDRADPSWRTRTGSVIKNYCFDERNSTQFYVSPTPTSALVVEILYSKQPARITATSTAIPVSDVYELTLWALTLAHAYAKNSKKADMAKFQFYFGIAGTSIGIKLQQQVSFSPKTQDNQ